jgi:D-alanyl-D-alanine carboxypeptidase
LRLGKTIAAAGVILFAATCFGAFPNGADLQQRIDDAVAKGVPGLQAHVRKGSGSWHGTAGVAAVETGERMTVTKRIRLASITKMMTYSAVMELVKQKKLQLADRVTSHLAPGALDGIPNAAAITLSHLLEHRSGLHNFNGEDGRDFFRDLFAAPDRGSRKWRPQELLAYPKKAGHRPTGRPGERVAYSSTGYIVLQMVLERLEQKPLDQIFRELLFEPLDMKASGVEGADLAATEIADSSPTATRGQRRPTWPGHLLCRDGKRFGRMGC